MRLSNRNKRPIWYATYLADRPAYDEFGNEIGTEIIYSKPQKAHWNVSAVQSDSEVEMFGIQAFETISVVAEKTGFELDNSSILWWGKSPALNEDGTTDTAHTHRVVGIRPSLNEVRFYAQEVSVTTAPRQAPGGAP